MVKKLSVKQNVFSYGNFDENHINDTGQTFFSSIKIQPARRFVTKKNNNCKIYFVVTNYYDNFFDFNLSKTFSLDLARNRSSSAMVQVVLNIRPFRLPAYTTVTRQRLGTFLNENEINFFFLLAKHSERFGKTLSKKRAWPRSCLETHTAVNPPETLGTPCQLCNNRLPFFPSGHPHSSGPFKIRFSPYARQALAPPPPSDTPHSIVLIHR